MVPKPYLPTNDYILNSNIGSMYRPSLTTVFNSPFYSTEMLIVYLFDLGVYGNGVPPSLVPFRCIFCYWSHLYIVGSLS